MNSTENTLNNKIRFRQKIAKTKDWADDFILLSGEIGIEICEDKSKKVKIGDGNTPWSDLDYIVVDIDLSNIINEINKIQIEVDEATLAAERLQYYGDSSIIPTDISYFTYETIEGEDGNLNRYQITGLTDEGKTLKEIIIPYQIYGLDVIEIGSEAFIGCVFLKTVILPNSIKNIQAAAFFGCKYLTDVNIPNSVIFIGGSVFTGCTSLTTINIPNSVTYMGNTFDNIENSIVIICNQGSYAESFAKENGIKYILDTVDPNEYAEKLAWERLVLERLQYYGDASIIPTDINLFTYTGRGNIEITGVNFDNTNTIRNNLVIPYEINGYKVTSIQSDAFKGYENLQQIILPNTITTIGASAFEGCTSLWSINLDNVIQIGDSAFKDCGRLDNLSMISTIMIGTGAFSGCTRLKSITIGGTTIRESAFYGCTNLRDINFINDINDKPNYEAMIYSYAFEGCTKIKNIDFPNYIWCIKNFAFIDCTNLTRISVPIMYSGHEVSIEENAFYGCNNLTIVCEQGSDIETYAKENGINCILDTVDPDRTVNIVYGEEPESYADGNYYLARDCHGEKQGDLYISENGEFYLMCGTDSYVMKKIGLEYKGEYHRIFSEDVYDNITLIDDNYYELLINEVQRHEQRVGDIAIITSVEDYPLILVCISEEVDDERGWSYGKYYPVANLQQIEELKNQINKNLNTKTTIHKYLGLYTDRNLVLSKDKTTAVYIAPDEQKVGDILIYGSGVVVGSKYEDLYVCISALNQEQGVYKGEYKKLETSVGVSNYSDISAVTWDVYDCLECRYNNVSGINSLLINVTNLENAVAFQGISDKFISSIVFLSGETAPTVSFDNEGHSCLIIGEDCQNNIFIPVSWKRYTITCNYDGMFIIFKVSGIEIPENLRS